MIEQLKKLVFVFGSILISSLCWGCLLQFYTIENCDNDFSGCYRSEHLGGNHFLHLCFQGGKPQFDIREWIDEKPSCKGIVLNLNQFALLNRQCDALQNYTSCQKKQSLGRDFYLHLCKLENKSVADIRLFVDEAKPTCYGVMLDLIQLELITRFNRDLM